MEKWIVAIGRFSGWLLLALVCIQFLVVIGRYLLGLNYLWGQELALYLHALIFLLACPWAVLRNRHVRIDVVSAKRTPLFRKRIELFGIVALLVPMMVLIIATTFPYVRESWAVLEGSPEVSGLPGRFLLKSLLPMFAFLMLVAAVAHLKPNR